MNDINTNLYVCPDCGGEVYKGEELMSSYDKLEYIRITLQEALDDWGEDDWGNLLVKNSTLDIEAVKQSLKYIDDLKYDVEVKG